jgi:hypothetical protein
MKNMGSPGDLLACDDADLCGKLGFLKDNRLTIAGLLVAGRDEFIAEHTPNHEWKYSRMRTDTDYETPPVSGRRHDVPSFPTGVCHPERGRSLRHDEKAGSRSNQGPYPVAA